MSRSISSRRKKKRLPSGSLDLEGVKKSAITDHHLLRTDDTERPSSSPASGKISFKTRPSGQDQNIDLIVEHLVAALEDVSVSGESESSDLSVSEMYRNSFDGGCVCYCCDGMCFWTTLRMCERMGVPRRWIVKGRIVYSRVLPSENWCRVRFPGLVLFLGEFSLSWPRAF